LLLYKKETNTLLKTEKATSVFLIYLKISFIMMKPVLQQLKNRRLKLGLKQKDMMLRIGISRQQYQHLELNGNPRLDTLELVATGLDSEIMLIPKEKVDAVIAALAENKNKQNENQPPDPWKDLLEDE
jgi:transcriptional regulator with XRE-family HTH domain